MTYIEKICTSFSQTFLPVYLQIHKIFSTRGPHTTRPMKNKLQFLIITGVSSNKKEKSCENSKIFKSGHTPRWLWRNKQKSPSQFLPRWSVATCRYFRRSPADSFARPPRALGLWRHSDAHWSASAWKCKVGFFLVIGAAYVELLLAVDWISSLCSMIASL